MQEDRDWIWVTGNHDPKIGERLGGTVVGDIEVEGITLRHDAGSGRVTHEIAGHMHPAARFRCTASRCAAPASSATAGDW